MQRNFVRLAIVLGLITAVGPFAIDMYLPAMPSMGGSLNASLAAVQMSLTAFFVTIGICQLLYGPISDMVGRKPPIYAGLVIFILGGIGCALAPTIEALIAFRILQGLGACGGMVVPRAIVRDLHTGPEATRLMSMLMLTVSISPILAPLTGSALIAVIGWRGVFWTLTGAGFVALLLAATQLEETRPAVDRVGSSWSSAFKAYRMLLLDRTFVGLTLVGAFGVSAFFVYLGSASFVLTGYYKLTPAQFSLCFALNAASFFGFSQLNGYLTARFGLQRVVRVAVAGLAAALTALALLTLAGAESLSLMIAFLFVGYGLLGLVVPTTSVLALDSHGAIAGAASALMGAIQMVVGAIVMAASGAFANGTPQPMIVGVAICGALSFIAAQATLQPKRPRTTAPSRSFG